MSQVGSNLRLAQLHPLRPSRTDQSRGSKLIIHTHCSCDHFIFGSFPQHWRGFVDKRKSGSQLPSYQAGSFVQVYVGTFVYLRGEHVLPVWRTAVQTSLDSWPFHGKSKQQLYYYSKPSVRTTTIENKNCCRGIVDIKVLLFVCLG